MKYRLNGNEIYVRVDKDDEILDSILKICNKESIRTAHFRGIGFCKKIELQTYLPEKEEFLSNVKNRACEMVSLDENVSPEDDGSLAIHAHSSFSFHDNYAIKMIGGHLKEAVVGYTAEIILTPAYKSIERMTDPKTGIRVWKL